MTYNFRIIAAATLVAILAFAAVASAGRNEDAYVAAEKRATSGTRVLMEQDTSTTVTSGGALYNGWGCNNVFVEPTVRTTRVGTVRRVYELNAYGGGPVWIVNPYCPPRSK